MPKRTFAEVGPSSPTPTSSSPLKRIHTSTPASRSTASSQFSTPYTPSVYSIPADSPTNPLGLKRRVNNLTLPKATPFSKHVALRFQLVSAAGAPSPELSLWNTSPGSSPSANPAKSKNPKAAQYAREGTYRIVQAPLSYTFRHLRALILFVFHGDPAIRPHIPGHLFAVQRGISIGSQARSRVAGCALNYPGHGTHTTPPLARGSRRRRGDTGQGEEDLEDEEEDASWRWEGEDDLRSDMCGTRARATRSGG
ncbi:hypothetical protein BC826DRAFT_1103451 [Russula brevipes]|nr:hypothetical protein BC826DRAFT_1103451 [Russula brevipes]